MENLPLTIKSETLDIKDIKNKLKILEYRVSNKNGNYDEEVKTAIEAFQNDHGIKISGIIDSKTLKALNDTYKLKNKDNVIEVLPTDKHKNKDNVIEVLPTDKHKNDGRVMAILATNTKPMLMLNYTSEYVRELQDGLIKLGYLKGPADAVFGKNTEDAVKRFQKANDLTDDGVVGTQTWEALDKALNNQLTTPPSETVPIVIPERPTLRIGSSGESVIELEQSLLSLGYFTGVPNVKFDEQTEAAVKQFQKKYNLLDDGIVGKQTWAAIEEAFSASPNSPPLTEPTLREGDTNIYVEMLQKRLEMLGLYEGEINGNFDKNTRDAVEKFQKLNFLTVDGVVGPEVWRVLNTKYNSLPINLPVLKEESTGDAVKILQEKLLQLGYYTSSVTGSFGYETTVAVKGFQTDNNIVSDGVVGAKTWETLYKATEVDIPNEPIPSGPKPTLKFGDRGEYVLQLQDELTKLMYYNSPITGVFDQNTLIAVQSFQDANRLTADGIVGRTTWYYLDSIYPPAVDCD